MASFQKVIELLMFIQICSTFQWNVQSRKRLLLRNLVRALSQFRIPLKFAVDSARNILQTSHLDEYLKIIRVGVLYLDSVPRE